MERTLGEERADGRADDEEGADLAGADAKRRTCANHCGPKVEREGRGRDVGLVQLDERRDERDEGLVIKGLRDGAGQRPSRRLSSRE